MPDRLQDQDLLTEAQAVELMPKWHLVQGRMHLIAKFNDFRRAASFVAKIGDMAEDADHHPEIDIRWNRVHLALNSHDVEGLTVRDVRLAAAIVPVVKVFGGEIDDGVFSETQITIDTADIATVRPFWAAVYGYAVRGDDALFDPGKSGPRIWFQLIDGPGLERNRVHIDVFVPAGQAEPRVQAAVEAGGRLVTAAYAPAWWVLADAEGNEACICTWRAATAGGAARRPPG
jgi:4a-hydroxytetrahydrobiopterin dehydratase